MLGKRDNPKHVEPKLKEGDLDPASRPCGVLGATDC